MEHKDLVKKFVDSNYEKPYFIEPHDRYEILKDKINEFIKVHNPSVVVKIGLGSGEAVLGIAGKVKQLVVVESSLKIIKDFRNKNGDKCKNVSFVNGEFDDLPIDYNIADMVVCLDYFDFSAARKLLDEIKRSLEFQKVFLFGGVVLNDKDFEGVFDDLMRKVIPIHNDYYLPEDLHTFMNLKDLTHVQDSIFEISRNIDNANAYIKESGLKNDWSQVTEFISENMTDLNKYYAFDEDNNYSEKYILAVYRRVYPKEEKI